MVNQKEKFVNEYAHYIKEQNANNPAFQDFLKKFRF